MNIDRRPPMFVSDLDSTVALAEAALDELAADGAIDVNSKSAHWWVGYLSSHLELLIAAVKASTTEAGAA